MKKLVSLALAVCLLAAVFCLTAAGENAYALTLDVGGSLELHENVSSYTLPAAAKAGMVFAGWRSERDGVSALYPAGATVSLTSDTTFAALFVEMTVRSPEFRFYGETDTGMRFLTEVNAGDYAALAALTEVRLGTLIAPLSFLGKETGAVLTPEALALNGHTKYLDVPAGDFYRTDEKTLTIAGSVHAIHPANSATPYLGVGYLSVTYADGTSARLFAPTDKTCTGNYYTLLSAKAGESDGRSPEQQALLADTLGGFVSVYCSSPANYSIGAGSNAFTMRFCKDYSFDGDFVLTVKPGEEFRFDRDMRVLIMDGIVLTASAYKLRDDGKTLTIPYSEYSDNY